MGTPPPQKKKQLGSNTWNIKETLNEKTVYDVTMCFKLNNAPPI